MRRVGQAWSVGPAFFCWRCMTYVAKRGNMAMLSVFLSENAGSLNFIRIFEDDRMRFGIAKFENCVFICLSTHLSLSLGKIKKELYDNQIYTGFGPV
jgi:hypothetical protein